MFAILHALGMFVADLFKSRCRLEAENLLLRHQLTSLLALRDFGLCRGIDLGQIAGNRLQQVGPGDDALGRRTIPRLSERFCAWKQF